MATFKDIIGQEQIKEHLTNAIEQGKISHAYVINGERFSGKEFIANVFAMALQCEHPDGVEPCQECHSCKQALSANQPDIIRVTHEKPNTIGVDDIRTQINTDIAIKPYSSPRKIYIILILTTNVDALLPTILSRCVVLNMKPVRDDLVKKYLMEELQIPDYKANVCVAFARGNLGKAKQLASSEEFDHIKEEAVSMLKYVQDMEINEMLAAVKKIQEYKFDVDDYLDILAIWYRDVLLFKATNDANHLIFKEEIQYIKKCADRCAYEGIEDILKALDKAKSRLKANVNFELTMELLLMAIKENS